MLNAGDKSGPIKMKYAGHPGLVRVPSVCFSYCKGSHALYTCEYTLSNLILGIHCDALGWHPPALEDHKLAQEFRSFFVCRLLDRHREEGIWSSRFNSRARLRTGSGESDGIQTIRSLSIH